MVVPERKEVKEDVVMVIGHSRHASDELKEDAQDEKAAVRDADGEERAAKAGDCRLRNDRLQQRSDKLSEQSPSAWSRQAASAKRGESSSSSTSGSSKRMISR